MADDIKKIVESDVIFTKHPHFYHELITLEETTGDAVDELLSMSKEYLTGITHVEGIFKKSIDICSELSSQINCLANKSRDLSRDEIENLLDMENHSMRTFHRMESLWKRITQKSKSGEDTVVFPKLNDKIQKVRLIIQQTHTSYQASICPQIPKHRANRRILPMATLGITKTPMHCNVVFHVKGVFANLQMKECITTRTNFRGVLGDGEQNELQRQTKNVVKRQHIMKYSDST